MTTPKTILVVEDERDLAELLAYNLRKAGHNPRVCHTGRQALDQVSQGTPDLVILDLMIPEFSGTEVAGRLRSNPKTAHVPIIMVTAKTAEADQLVGLASGADDYVTKPFSMKVLMARVDAVLRRAGQAQSGGPTLHLGGVSIDPRSHEVLSGGEPVKLTLTEFRLLAALVQGGGRVLTRSELMSRAMGPGVTVTERTIDVHITAIRKKLGAAGAIVRTVRGVGYRATAESSPQDDADEPEPATVLP